MPDATLTQANPVSGTFYPVLPATENVRIITMAAVVTWATTQPTPLRLRVIIDGQTLYFDVTNPITATWYGATIREQFAPAAQALTTIEVITQRRAFLLEGKSVQIDMQITWAVTQPTPVDVIVKYAVLRP